MPISPEKPEAPSRTHPMVTHKSADNRSPLACSVAASPPITPHASCLINIQSMPATLDIRYASERRAVDRFINIHMYKEKTSSHSITMPTGTR